MADGKEAHEVEPASNEDTLLGNNDFLDQSGGRVCLVRLTERVESCWGLILIKFIHFNKIITYKFHKRVPL